MDADLAGPSSPRSAASATVLDHVANTAKENSVSTAARPTSKISNRSAPTSTIAADKIRLDILLLDGQRRFFLVDAASCVKSVRERIYDEWPHDWPPRPISSSNMRLLYLGHVLDDKAALCNNLGTKTIERVMTGAMVPGQSYVVHLLIKQEPTKESKDEDSASAHLKQGGGDPEDVSGGCCCVIC